MILGEARFSEKLIGPLLRSSHPLRTYLGEAVDGVGVDLGVRGLVHEAGSHHVEGGDGAGHEESGAGGGHGLGGDSSLAHSSLVHHNALDGVVAGHLRSVEDHRAENVAVQAAVETGETGGITDILSGRDDRRGGGAFASHHLCLEDVERVAYEDDEDVVLRPQKLKMCVCVVYCFVCMCLVLCVLATVMRGANERSDEYYVAEELSDDERSIIAENYEERTTEARSEATSIVST